jgi:hypothetical protein
MENIISILKSLNKKLEMQLLELKTLMIIVILLKKLQMMNQLIILYLL